MKNKTIEFFETQNDNNQMIVTFEEWYEAKFELFTELWTADFTMSNSDLQTLGRAIIKKLNSTPYQVLKTVSKEDIIMDILPEVEMRLDKAMKDLNLKNP